MQKVIVALAATANPFLDEDSHLNVARVQALNAQVTAAFGKAQDDSAKPIRAVQTFVISRKAKPVKFSSALNRKGDLKYLTQRALKIGVVKRMTERSSIRNMPLLAVYDSAVIGAPLAAKVKQAMSAINTHLKRADKTKTSVGKVKAKIRDEGNAMFNESIALLSKILGAGGLKDSDKVIGTSMFGKTMLVKLSADNVVSVGKSDIAKFRAAQKAAKEAS